MVVKKKVQIHNMWVSSQDITKLYFFVFLHSSVGKESTGNAGDLSSIPGSGRPNGEGIGYPFQYSWVFLVAQLIKNLLQCRRPRFNPWVGTIPWRRKRLPLQCSGLENSKDCSPWSHKESDTTEWLSLHLCSLLIKGEAWKREVRQKAENKLYCIILLRLYFVSSELTYLSFPHTKNFWLPPF